ncbi:MAG: hypothetical protein KDK96_01860 [Chlamydiia bacterium]|nr:hypothetical protein [Chlamydiia bacterium]
MNREDLIGKWKINRIMTHPDGSPKGRMMGMGQFDLYEGNQLLYQEQLWHETENEDLLFATKFYRYHFLDRSIAIYFYQEENNRLFMTLDKEEHLRSKFFQDQSLGFIPIKALSHPIGKSHADRGEKRNTDVGENQAFKYNRYKGNASCKEDRYSLTWDWINMNHFMTRYQTVGPKKNYIIESEFLR